MTTPVARDRYHRAMGEEPAAARFNTAQEPPDTTPEDAELPVDPEEVAEDPEEVAEDPELAELGALDGACSDCPLDELELVVVDDGLVFGAVDRGLWWVVPEDAVATATVPVSATALMAMPFVTRSISAMPRSRRPMPSRRSPREIGVRLMDMSLGGPRKSPVKGMSEPYKGAMRGGSAQTAAGSRSAWLIARGLGLVHVGVMDFLLVGEAGHPLVAALALELLADRIDVRFQLVGPILHLADLALQVPAGLLNLSNSVFTLAHAVGLPGP